MAETDFRGLVANHFGYLLDEYGYTLIDTRQHPDPFADGTIVFRSSAVTVELWKDRASVGLIVTPTGEPAEARLSLEEIISYRTDGKKPDIARFQDFAGKVSVRLEYQLAKDAVLLREYCDDVLRGDLSWWTEALEYSVRMMQQDWFLWSKCKSTMPPHIYEPILAYIESRRMRS